MSVAGIHLDGRRVPPRVPPRVPLRDPVSERSSLGVGERVASLARSWTPRHAAGSRMVHVDAIDVASAAPYLAVWASVLCVVQLVVYTFGPTNLVFLVPVVIVLPVPPGQNGIVFVTQNGQIRFIPGGGVGTITLQVTTFNLNAPGAITVVGAAPNAFSERASSGEM